MISGRERFISGQATWLGLLCAAGFACAVDAAPIKSIFIDSDGLESSALSYDFDANTQQGILSIDLKSFTVLVTRDVDGVDVPEFFSGASFHLTATVLTDQSSPPVALGTFDSVEFELRNAKNQILLAGTQETSAGLMYSEALVSNIMFISGGPVDVNPDGILAPDFDIQAELFGLGFRIDPGTDTFDLLNTDHTGSVLLNLFPIPEPSSMVLLLLAMGARRGRRRSVKPRVALNHS